MIGKDCYTPPTQVEAVPHNRNGYIMIPKDATSGPTNSQGIPDRSSAIKIHENHHLEHSNVVILGNDFENEIDIFEDVNSPQQAKTPALDSTDCIVQNNTNGMPCDPALFAAMKKEYSSDLNPTNAQATVSFPVLVPVFNVINGPLINNAPVQNASSTTVNKVRELKRTTSTTIKTLEGLTIPSINSPRAKSPPPAPGEKRIKCPECSVTLKRQATLERHMLIHRGIKPYECSVCKRRFRQKHHLQSHEMLHTGERPHSCILCSKRFRMRHHLLEHERSSHGVQLS